MVSSSKPVGGGAELELGVDGGARHPELLAGVRLLLFQVVLPKRHVDPPHRLQSHEGAIMFTGSQAEIQGDISGQ